MPSRRGLVAPQNTFLEKLIRRSNSQRESLTYLSIYLFFSPKCEHNMRSKLYGVAGRADWWMYIPHLCVLLNLDYLHVIYCMFFLTSVILNVRTSQINHCYQRRCVGRVISGICDCVCVCVCLSVCVLKEKRLELSTPNLVHV